MRILIIGTGKMGSFFSDLLSFDHETAIIDKDPMKLRFTYNVQRFMKYEEVREFAPELVINCVSLNHTLSAFEEITPYLLDESGQPRKDCILSDIASVKTGLKEYYRKSGFRYVSVHPMFGPTFASLNHLSTENAVIIKEEDSDPQGLEFFSKLFSDIHLNVRYYSFEGHDKITAYSLSIPFASTLVFGSVMHRIDAPGTTFKKHLAIAQGLLSEDDCLLCEILSNPYTPEQLNKIIIRLQQLADLSERHDTEGIKVFLNEVRERLA